MTKSIKIAWKMLWKLEAMQDFKKIYIKIMFNPSPFSLLHFTILVNDATSWMLEKVEDAYHD